MAISANSVFEVHSGGNDANGGGFVTGASGTDRSLVDTPQATLTTLSVVNATTTKVTVSLTDYTVLASDIGNIAQLSVNGGALAFYQITGADTGLNTWTVDRSLGTAAQTVAGRMGGALASPGMANAAMNAAGQITYIKNDGSGIYSITSASTAVANGSITWAASFTFVGYTSTRTIENTDARPTLQLNVAGATILTGVSSRGPIVNCIFDGNGQTTAKIGTNSPLIVRCHIKNFNTASGALNCVYCTATTNSAGVFQGFLAYCEAYANTATPFVGSVGFSMFVSCLSYGNTGSTTDGYTVVGGLILVNCVADRNGRDGFSFSDTNRNSILVNCVSTNNAVSATGYGYNVGSVRNLSLIFCASFGNTAATNGTPGMNLGFITLTADPFTNSSGGVFVLNNLTGGGALLRGAGFPATFPAGLTTNISCVGAAQARVPFPNMFLTGGMNG